MGVTDMGNPCAMGNGPDGEGDTAATGGNDERAPKFEFAERRNPGVIEETPKGAAGRDAMGEGWPLDGLPVRRVSPTASRARPAAAR